MTAFCGLNCSECPAYLATKTGDDKKRIETAKKWSEIYKSDIKPEDINCMGCISVSDVIFNYCNICEIRKCAKIKEVKNCACCPDFGCEKLLEFFKIAPEAKRKLDEIRNKGI